MRKLFLLSLLCIIFASCEKRYEEGPCISFIEPENRIAGIWHIASVYVDDAEQDGIGSSDSLSACRLSFFRNSDNGMFVSLKDSGDVVWAESLVRYDSRVINLTFGLSTISGYESCTMPVFHAIPVLGTELTWKIIKLKQDEMWMKTEYGGSVYELRYGLLIDYDNL